MESLKCQTRKIPARIPLFLMSVCVCRGAVWVYFHVSVYWPLTDDLFHPEIVAWALFTFLLLSQWSNRTLWKGGDWKAKAFYRLAFKCDYCDQVIIDSVWPHARINIHTLKMVRDRSARSLLNVARFKSDLDSPGLSTWHCAFTQHWRIWSHQNLYNPITTYSSYSAEQ